MRRKPQKRPRQPGPRMNDRIRLSPVRVVLEDGTQLGVMPTDEARRRARDEGKDLVEVNPNVRPPVCRIVDYGRFKYEQAKKDKESKKKQTKVEIKEIRLRPKTEQHDIAFKAKHARRFLESGNKVQFMVRFKGRENAHPQTGRAILDKIMVELLDVAKLERAARYENRTMTMMVAPK